MESEEDTTSGSPEASVIEANVRFYRQIAAKYDRYEACVSDRNLQQLLNRDVDRIAVLLGKRDGPIECLDCGGGSGNLSLKMLKKGWTVTAVDISSDMLALLETKAAREGFSPRLINESISKFLGTIHENYDVVAFSSVLHHIYSYLPVVMQAVDHIKQGGIFYSNFDPVISKHPYSARLFETLDTAVAKAIFDSSDFFPGVLRRIRKSFRKPDGQHGRPVVGPGDLAEYHAKTGVDDLAIIQYLDENGFSVCEHTRWSSGRTALTKGINRRLRLMESFKIVAQRVPK